MRHVNHVYATMDSLVDAQVEDDQVQNRICELTEQLNIAVNAQMWDVVLGVLVDAHALLSSLDAGSMAHQRAARFMEVAVDEARCATAKPLN